MSPTDQVQTQQPVTVVVNHPAADPAHPNHLLIIAAAIVAALQAATPSLIQILHPKAAKGLVIGETLGAITIQTILQSGSADTVNPPAQ